MSVLQRELKMITDGTFRPEGRTGDELMQLMSTLAGEWALSKESETLFEAVLSPGRTKKDIAQRIGLGY